MRRLIAVAGVIVIVGSAAPASAHPVRSGGRDPFQPLVFEGVAGAPQGDDAGAAVPAAEPAPSGPRRGLPDTGSSLDAWVLLAYLLVATGASALLVARNRRVIVPTFRREASTGN